MLEHALADHCPTPQGTRVILLSASGTRRVGELRAHPRLKPLVVLSHGLSLEQKNMLVFAISQVWEKAVAK